MISVLMTVVDLKDYGEPIQISNDTTTYVSYAILVFDWHITRVANSVMH